MAGTLRSSAKVSAAVLASRVLALGREGLQAAIFGVTALTDAYLVAFRIPNLLRDLFAEGALSSAFVPTFAEAMTSGGRERAYRLGNLVVTVLLVLTGLLTIAGVVWARPIATLISGGFAGNEAKLLEATLLTRVMMPILLLVSVSAAWMGMLNAQQRFTAPAFAPALFNVVSILVGLGLVLFGRGMDSHRALFIWSLGTTAAGLCQALIQLPDLWRLGYRPRLALAGAWRDPGLRRIARLMAPAVVGLAAVQVNVFVNTQFAASLGDGPIAQLNYAFRLFYLPIGLFGVALATVTTARASADAARGDRQALVARVEEGAQGVWLLALPSAVGLVVLAEPVVALLFQRWRFTAADTAATVPVVQAYMLGVLPYSLVKVISPAFFTVDRPRIPMLASIGAVAANVTFNALTYRTLRAPGLALGTTLAALVNLGILRVAFRGVVGRAQPGGGRERVAVAIASGALAVFAAGAWHFAARAIGPSRSWRALLLFAVIAAGFMVYAAVLGFMGHPAAVDLWRLPRKISRRVLPRR